MADGDHIEEYPDQMSPFSHARWDMDEELTKRRKQQEYQNLNRPVEKEVQQCTTEQPIPVKETKVVEKEEKLTPCPPPQQQQRRSVENLSFDIPAPANLFPVIKFPERRGSKSDTRAYKEASPTIPVPNAEEQIKLPPKIVFRDVLPEKQRVESREVGSKENVRIYHYGAPLPLWPP